MISPFKHLRGKAVGKPSPFANLFRKPAAPAAPATPPSDDVATMARKIIKAAAVARGEIIDEPVAIP